MKTLVTLSVAGLLLISGCRTYEISPIPPGHPASTDAAPAPHHRSTTLDSTTPVDPQGKASDRFGDTRTGEDQEAGHAGHAGHGEANPPAAHAADHAPDSPPQACPVSGQKLGSMGKPVVVEHAGRYLMLCCAGCVEEFKKDPERYLNPAEHGEAEPANDDAPAQPQADPKPQPDHHDH